MASRRAISVTPVAFLPTLTQGALAAATPTPPGTAPPTRLPATRTSTVTLTPPPTSTPAPATNTATAIPTLPPTRTPLPNTRTPTPSPTPAVAVYRTTISLPTYPYNEHLVISRSVTYNLSFPRLDWDAYTADAARPAARAYAAIIMENEYLRLSILPELGGRIYEAVFKPSGHNVFYRNPVIKPTRWGHATQGWWLAAGGMEWCLPIEEHGYEWGVSWPYSIAQAAGQASVTVWDTEAGDRIRARVTITLSAGRSYFTVSPRIENPTGRSVGYQFWLNAMIALGGANRVSPATEFILPATEVTVHSSGDRALPLAGQAMAWPVYNGRAMNLYSSWRSYLGVFERPQGQRGFVGAYDHASAEGLLRIYPPEAAPGSKLFGSQGLDPEQWTDDSSAYFELHGGVTPTFWDQATLAAGDAIAWSERWYPFLAIGSVDEANDEAALSLDAAPGGYRVGVAVTRQRAGRVVLAANGQEVWARAATLAPGRPFVETVQTSATGVTLRLEDEQGQTVASMMTP
jgi:hypothetical protein